MVTELFSILAVEHFCLKSHTDRHTDRHTLSHSTRKNERKTEEITSQGL